jgi:hypothetical protein
MTITNIFSLIIFIFLTIDIYILGYEIRTMHKDSSCSNTRLQKLGCKCISDYEQDYLMNSRCENGFYKLSCLFNNQYNRNDYFEIIISELSQMSSFCWYGFEFKNVFKISSNWLQNLNLIKLRKNSNFLIDFKHINKLDSYSFEYSNQTNFNFVIKIDSLMQENFDDQLVLDDKCFNNIKNCKLLILTNFLNKIDLKASQFLNSNIETLMITFSNYNGIRYDLFSKTSTSIQNIILDYCYIDKINQNTFGSFNSLTKAVVQNSNVELIERNAFQFCCSNLEQLHLNNNQIKVLTGRNIFKGLNNLVYLNLESNPIEKIDRYLFDSFRSTLKKLNLGSTNLIQLNDFYYDLFEIEELVLSRTPYLDMKNIDFIFKNSPKLTYLDLKESNMIKQSSNLNNIFDKLESIIKYQKDKMLKFIDLSYYDINIDDEIFTWSFYQNDLCLWNNLLNSTFIIVNENHECNCGLFYLYRNLLNYDFPYNIPSILNGNEINDQFLHQYFRINMEDYNLTEWQFVFLKMPKCYQKLWLEDFSLDLIRLEELKCEIWPVETNSLNCSDKVKTTREPKTTHSTQKLLSSTGLVSYSTNLYYSKKFPDKYSIPIIISVFILWIFVITSLIYKARYDYKKKFLKKMNKTLNGSSVETKELNNLSIISSNNLNSVELFNEYNTSEDVDSLISFS